jgi:hypothetical protein
LFCAVIFGATSLAVHADGVLDQLEERLTVHSSDGYIRARLSGTLELEGYKFSQPAPGVIEASGETLLNPRMTAFLDLQIGGQLYAFVQARGDRGFDPSDEEFHARLDEYTVRLTPWKERRFNLQVGKFATVVGNWVPRHGAWDNPFVNAPLPYEHLTGMWDSAPALSAGMLLGWAHVRPQPSRPVAPPEKYLRLPIIWGPSYTTGVAISGEAGHFRYAAEVKNAALSSRPSTWEHVDEGWEHPTLSGRLVFQPNPTWAFGASASTGSYLLPAASSLLPIGRGLGDYRQIVFGQDVSFAWHHLQVWAEVFENRFEVPGVGDADTTAYYVEAKYKVTPQLFVALRWNEQLFASIPDGAGGRSLWGGDVWRADGAVGYRFTPQAELKLQYSAQYEKFELHGVTSLLAAQFVLKF